LTVRDSTLVAALGDAIARRIGEPRYQLWFEHNTRFRWEDGVLTVGVPNRHFEEWLQKTFLGAVREASAEVFGETMEVRFLIDPELFRAARQEQTEAKERLPSPPSIEDEPEDAPRAFKQREPRPEPPPAPDPRGKQKAKKEDDRPTLFDKRPTRPARRWRKLDEFVSGACNRVAHAAALSVAEAPMDCPSPLVVHGPVGTGKSHLLEGVYVSLRKAHPEWRVTFVTSEDFTNRFVQAMRLNKLSSFRKQFRDTDAFLLDDVHFLATKKATQEEFLHTLDTLVSDGKPVVLTCDCHPRLNDAFPPELTDRLLGGAVWGVMPPDGDTRLNILKAKSAARGETLIAEDVLKFLAAQLRGNVRELEGALNSLRHYGRVTGRTIDVNLAREALGDLLRHAVRVVQLPDIDLAVCKVLRLPPGSLQQKQRAWTISHPRMLAMYLARKHTSAAYSEIGQHFGDRNHSTAVAAEKKVRQWLEANGEMSLGERSFRVREVVELAERELLR
jgi:chromosomal replication initiator protein